MCLQRLPERAVLVDFVAVQFEADFAFPTFGSEIFAETLEDLDDGPGGRIAGLVDDRKPYPALGARRKKSGEGEGARADREISAGDGHVGHE